jgi:hypothetical protein
MQEGWTTFKPSGADGGLVDLLLDPGERSSRQEVLRTLTEQSADPSGAVDRWS